MPKPPVTISAMAGPATRLRAKSDDAAASGSVAADGRRLIRVGLTLPGRRGVARVVAPAVRRHAVLRAAAAARSVVNSHARFGNHQQRATGGALGLLAGRIVAGAQQLSALRAAKFNGHGSPCPPRTIAMANRFLRALSSTEVIGARGSNAQSDERNDGEGHNAAADKERYQHRGSRLSPGNLLRLRQPNDFKERAARPG